MRLFKDIKKNEIKESVEQIQKNVTSKDLAEQYKKAVNRYKRHLKEYDEEQSQEKYKELIDVHTELKLIEKQIQELKLIDNELNDNDFNVKSEDINIQNEEAIPIVAESIIQPKEEMITGDDGIIRPKSMHDQIESNKCLFCEEKFGFTQDWNIHMMEKHPEELIEYNKQEIEKLASTNENVAKIVDMVNIAEVIFEENEKLESENKEPIIHENLSNTEIIAPENTYDMKKEDPDLYVIQQIMKEKNVTTKEEYDKIMNEAEKDSPYAINYKPDIKPLNNEPQIIPNQIKEIAEKLESMTPSEEQPENKEHSKKEITQFRILQKNIKSIINDESKDNQSRLNILKSLNLEESGYTGDLVSEKNTLERNTHTKKLKFSIKHIFKKKKYSKLKGIEAYCNICKHTVQQHEYLGKSEGCVKCGCLKTVQEILEINEVDLKYGEEKQILDNGIYCVCGHSQLTHKENAKFCEVEDCHCVRFRTK